MRSETLTAMGGGSGVTCPGVATNTLAPTDEPLAHLVNPVTVAVGSAPATTSGVHRHR